MARGRLSVGRWIPNLGKSLNSCFSNSVVTSLPFDHAKRGAQFADMAISFCQVKAIGNDTRWRRGAGKERGEDR